MCCGGIDRHRGCRKQSDDCDKALLGTSELSREDLLAWLATLSPEGRERIMEVLQARVEASVWRQEVLENVADETERMKEEVLQELRRLLDDLRQ